MRARRISVPASAVCMMALVVAFPGMAHAQRAGENAVNSADDAFGSSVGLESTGIYSEADTRGFSPSKAGNARIDGIYYDPVGGLSARLRQGNVVRVAFAAEDYPFQAPTGIIEYRFKPFPDKAGISPAYNLMAFGGHIAELDIRAPIVGGKLGFVGGAAHSDLRSTDGSGNRAYGFTGRLIGRFGDVEISPFASVAWFNEDWNHPLVQVTGDRLPKLPEVRRYLGQDWAVGYRRNHQLGLMGKAILSKGLSLRAGVFYAEGTRQRNFSEIFTLQPQADAEGDFLARHLLIADPSQALHATSGEAQLGWRFGSGRWQHRLLAGFRARRRITESGGSSLVNSPSTLSGQLVRYGDPDPIPEQSFDFHPVNRGEVRQSSFMLGYTGKLEGVGSIELGLQKARYRATIFDSTLNRTTTSRDDPWLYNATLRFGLTSHLSFYIGTQKGLEDSGAAPENALNRNEQLPATRATQYEGGLRWKFPGGQLAANVFQITKPYFTFDASRNFVQLGNVRHRGIEASLSGQFGKRLHLLAGIVAMQPRIAGGLRPAGTPSLFARIDANYRTDIFGGLTPTVAVFYNGSRALSPGALPSLGGRQLEVPGYATVDLGLRQQFHIGKTPVSFRATLVNAFDAASWKVVAANTVFPEERRRFNMTVAADF
ncbi:MAG: TonB-dependent receptor [Novosphingobium sp.]